MKTLLYSSLLGLLIFIFQGCQTDSNPIPSPEIDIPKVPEIPKPLTEEQLKEQLYGKECSNPKKYLNGKLGYEGKYKNLLSMKINSLKISGSISNLATLATFKDIKIKLKFISKTGACVIEHEFIVYEFVNPNRTIQYETELEITNQNYNDINNLEWSIVNASCK